MSEKTEDLITGSFQGLETHGCRETTIVPAGRIVHEVWLAKVGNEKHSLSFPVRDIDESPDTGKHTRELTSLKFEEPDPATFMPPKDYTIKRVEMLEVPCQQASVSATKP